MADHQEAEALVHVLLDRLNHALPFLSRLMNAKAIPSVTPERHVAEALLNDAAARVAGKNDVEVPDEIWQSIDEHMLKTYGPKPAKDERAAVLGVLEKGKKKKAGA